MSPDERHNRAAFVANRLLPFDVNHRLRWGPSLGLYALAYLFHFLSWNTRYWDDWVLYIDAEKLAEQEKQCPIDRCKVPFSYLWEQPLLSIGPWALRTAVVAGFVLGAYFFWMTLGKIRSVSERARSTATLLMLLLPINGARVALTNARATHMLLLFLFGAFLLTSRRVALNIFGLILIAVSAFQPSLQVFGLAAVLILLGKDYEDFQRISRKTIFLSAVLIAIPLLHRFLFSDVMVALSLAKSPDGYNTIRLATLIRAALVCGLLCVPFLASIALHIRSRQPITKFRTSLVQIGLLVLALGTFPYMAVGHFANLSDWIIVFLPDNSDWDSRHQLLQGPGYALLLTGLIAKVKEASQGAFLTAIIVGCLVLNSSTYANYYVDGLKQRDIISALQSQIADLETTSLFVFVDDARDVNARGRGVRDYEWDALTEEALGRQVEIIGISDTLGSAGCVGEQIGKTITIRKVSGRLKALLTRTQIVNIDITDLVACK